MSSTTGSHLNWFSSNCRMWKTRGKKSGAHGWFSKFKKFYLHRIKPAEWSSAPKVSLFLSDALVCSFHQLKRNSLLCACLNCSTLLNHQLNPNFNLAKIVKVESGSYMQLLGQNITCLDPTRVGQEFLDSRASRLSLTCCSLLSPRLLLLRWDSGNDSDYSALLIPQGYVAYRNTVSCFSALQHMDEPLIVFDFQMDQTSSKHKFIEGVGGAGKF